MRMGCSVGETERTPPLITKEEREHTYSYGYLGPPSSKDNNPFGGTLGGLGSGVPYLFYNKL